MEPRIAALEADMENVKIRLAVAESNIKEISRKMDKIESNTGKIIWLIGSVIVVSLLNLIIKGGVQL